MADAFVSLESARGVLEATEGAGGTPSRLLDLPPGSLRIEHNVAEVESRRGWAKVDDIADLFPEIEDVALVIENAQGDWDTLGWYLSLMAASGSGTPTTVDTSAYSRTFTPHTSDRSVGAAGVRSGYIEASPSNFAATNVWKMKGLIPEEMTVQMRKAAQGSDSGVTWGGRFRTASAPTTTAAFTGSPSDLTPDLILGQQMVAFVDDTYGGIGSTNDPEIVEATLRYTDPAVFHDGGASPASAAHTSMHRPGPRRAELSFIRKFSDMTEYDKYTGSSFVKGLRAVRIEFEGKVVGATTAKQTFQLDFVGKYTGPRGSNEERNGLIYAQHTLLGLYDSGITAPFEIFLQNGVSVAHTTT